MGYVEKDTLFREVSFIVCCILLMLLAFEVRSDPITCLARNIYHEARGEPVEGQVAVAWVTVNRVSDSRWPGTVCGVVGQYKQFSWTLQEPLQEHDSRAYAIATRIATNVLSGSYYDNTGGANHYHTTDISPYWEDVTKATKVIGNHIFYRY